MCPFDYTDFVVSGKGWYPNNTSWKAVVTPTDCPKSNRNHCVIGCSFCWCFGFVIWFYILLLKCDIALITR